MNNQECDFCYDPIFYAKHKGARFHKNCPDNNPLPRSESQESKETATAEEFKISVETVKQARIIVKLVKKDEFYDINQNSKEYMKLWVEILKLKEEMGNLSGDEE